MTKLKIFKISRTDPVGYDEYDSAVVIAESEEDAVAVLKTSHKYVDGDYVNGWGEAWRNYENLEIHEVIPMTKEVVIESFNAG